MTPQGWQPNNRYEHVWVIVRFDEFHGTDAPLEDRVNVMKVLLDPEGAAAEVERLNPMRTQGDPVRYVARAARLVP